jgi:MFS family permease
MLAMMGDMVEHVLTYWIIFEAFHSPTLAGFAVISHWLPYLLFSVHFGNLADRLDCRRIIQGAQLIFVALSLSWGLLYVSGSLEVWHAVILLIVHGVAGALWGPPSQLIINDIVGSERLQSAIRLNSTALQLGFLFGPAIGGAMLEVFGISIAFFVNAALYLPLTVWLLSVPYTGHRQPATRPSQRMGMTDALEVFRQISSNRSIVAMVTLSALSTLFVGSAFQAQMPEFADRLGTGDSGLAYSALLMATAAGAVSGGLVLEGTSLLPPKTGTAIICTALWCVAMTGFAIAPSYPIAFTLLFVAGILRLTSNSMARTLVQILAPPHLHGRVIGLFQTTLGLQVGSGLMMGILGTTLGVQWALALSALMLLALTVALLGYALGVPRLVRNGLGQAEG